MTRSKPRLRFRRFFDLPREIRDDIYLRAISFSDIDVIWLAPRGGLIGRGSDYKCYRKIVRLFTTSRKFHNEAVPVFWKAYTFRTTLAHCLAPETVLPPSASAVRTSIDYFGASGKACLRSLIIRIECFLFVKAGSSDEYYIDFGTTVHRLLEELPNLQYLDIRYSCKFQCTPNYEVATSLLRETIDSHLELDRSRFIHINNSIASSMRHDSGVSIEGIFRGPVLRDKEQEGTEKESITESQAQHAAV